MRVNVEVRQLQVDAGIVPWNIRARGDLPLGTRAYSCLDPFDMNGLMVALARTEEGVVGKRGHTSGRRRGLGSWAIVASWAGASLFAGCAPAAATESVRGTAFFRERIALPPGAVLEVKLEDVSRADAPAVTIGEVRLEGAGNPPYHFEIPYEPAQIDERSSYAVRARLLVDGTLWFATDTHYPVLTRGAGDEVELLLRRVGGGPMGSAGPLGALPASFEGVLPCADCEGINHHLDLFDDGSFFYRLVYLGRDRSFDDIGSYRISDGSRTLTLHGGREAPVAFRIVGPSTLRKLDLEGREIASSLNDELARADAFDPIEPQLLMRGMYRYMADAALFSECLTGRSFPVSMEADNVALERAYLETPHEPGAPVLVSLEGRLAERPAMEGDGTVLSLVPERFIGIWPRQTCGNGPSGGPSLAGTTWKLIGLGEETVMFGEPSRQPSLTLTRDGRASGFDGCNRLTGSYEVAGRSIELGRMAATMMACADGMEHAAAFAAALEGTRSYAMDGAQLVLLDGDGRPLARFEEGAVP